MSRYLKILITIVGMTWGLQGKADSWIDPTWREMLDSSDVVALVEYTGSGEFQASARVLVSYKGKLQKGDEIWISNFSNRYGPIDKMKKGDRYIVFLNFREPKEKRIEYWKEELKEKPELKDYVDAFIQSKAYNVWSPTSGDLKVEGGRVQYDLTQSSHYGDQAYYSFKEFESFLVAYYDRSKAKALCESLLSDLKTADDNDLHAQQIMQLYFLGFSRYEKVFEMYAEMDDAPVKYALAQLMGNIRSEQSRRVLIQLLEDKNSLVQGEAVRQLRKEPAEIVAPILLKQLKTASGRNFGPTNLMDPVMNRIDGGKAEIIETLGKLKYKPAVPELLLLLETKDEDQFEMVIEAIKEIGSKEYIPYINKHLDNKTKELIFTISMMIAEDSLTECLPSFKNFISSCNRNTHPTYDYTISTCCGIGKFRDSATVAFLLSDYERFFSYKDTLESSKQNSWIKKYIEAFTDLKIKEARPLVYQSLYDWFGVNEDFGKHPELFDVKKRLEDSLRALFSTSLGKEGYQLNHTIAFIGNTAQIPKGEKPITRYLIEVTVPMSDNGRQQQEKIAKTLDIKPEDVHIVFDKGWYYLEKQERFEKHLFSTPLRNFLSYVEVIPNSNDLIFLKAILKEHFIADEYFEKRIRELIDVASEKIK